MNQKRNQNVQVAVNKKFKHDLSHQHLTTIDWFRLQPIGCMEMVAGDKFDFNVRTLIEASPLATKVYGSAHLDIHAFFVPFRILWKDWNSYYYGDGSNNSFTVPYLPFGAAGFVDLVFGTNSTGATDATKKERRSVFGSLGYPTTTFHSSTTYDVERNLSALPARAYQQVWWDWFRDSVNIPESTKLSYLNTAGGMVAQNTWTTLFTPRYRTFRKDYITTIMSDANANMPGSVAYGAFYETDENSTGTGKRTMLFGGTSIYASDNANTSTTAVSKLLQGVRVPVLRGAIAMQKFLERLGITGSRPLERIVSSFGMRPAPERLDMSEFIGYKSIPVGIDGLINTGSSQKLDGASSVSPFGDDTAADFGTMQGRSSAAGQTDNMSYTADEHGYLIVIASIVPDYINGNVVDKLFTRGRGNASQGNIDFFQPDFDGSGYQPVLLGDIANPHVWDTAWNPSNYDPSQVVGYQPYAEDYRQILDKISGDFNERESHEYLRNMAFVRDLTTMFPTEVVAGLNLTTPDNDDRKVFDNHFQVTDGTKDHFIMNNYFVVDALRPISNSVLPTELSDMANRDLTEVAKGGIRL